MTALPDRSVQLLVVGAGPVGLLAALSAARRGLSVEVLDQSLRGFGRGYATLLHPRSLELLEQLGLAKKLIAAGHLLTGVTLHAGEAKPVRLELPAPALAVSQNALEEALLSAVRAEHVEIRQPCQATTIQQVSSGVNVRVVRRELVTTGSPASYSEWQPIDSSLVHAEFVIGADGYDSRVRAALGIDATTLGSAESFAMFEIPTPADSGNDIQLVFSDGLASAIVPLSGSRARLGFQITSALDQEPNVERLRGLLSERAPWFHDGMNRIDWSTVVDFERRLVRRFGSGRVWLAGDAAHVTGPFGAHSMNLGLSEADELVRRISACERGASPPESLEHYGEGRQREWHKLLGFHVKYELLPNAPSWLAPLARQIGATLPASGADLSQLYRQLGLTVS